MVFSEAVVGAPLASFLHKHPGLVDRGSVEKSKKDARGALARHQA